MTADVRSDFAFVYPFDLRSISRLDLFRFWL